MKTLLITLFLFYSFSSFCQKKTIYDEMYSEKKYEKIINQEKEIFEKNDFAELVILAKSFQQLDLRKKALECYNVILTNDENNIEALVAVGALFIDFRELENALFATERALKYDPENKNAKYNLAVIYYLQENMDGFNQYINEQLELNAKNYDLIFLKAISFFRTQDYKLAIPYFVQIETLNPSNANENSPNFNFHYAYCLYKENQFELAKQKFTISSKIEDENQINSFYYLALINIQMGNKIDACEAYTKAINLGDITLTKEADSYCDGKNDKKNKLVDRGFKISF